MPNLFRSATPSKVYIAHQHVVRRGEVGSCMYFVGRGCVSVRHPLQPHTVVAQLSDGSYFGEIALMVRTPRSCDVVAEVAVDLLGLNADDFSYVLQARAQRAIYTVSKYSCVALFKLYLKKHPMSFPSVYRTFHVRRLRSATRRSGG